MDNAVSGFVVVLALAAIASLGVLYATSTGVLYYQEAIRTRATPATMSPPRARSRVRLVRSADVNFSLGRRIASSKQPCHHGSTTAQALRCDPPVAETTLLALRLGGLAVLADDRGGHGDGAGHRSGRGLGDLADDALGHRRLCRCAPCGRLGARFRCRLHGLRRCLAERLLGVLRSRRDSPVLPRPWIP